MEHLSPRCVLPMGSIARSYALFLIRWSRQIRTVLIVDGLDVPRLLLQSHTIITNILPTKNTTSDDIPKP